MAWTLSTFRRMESSPHQSEMQADRGKGRGLRLQATPPGRLCRLAARGRIGLAFCMCTRLTREQ